MRPVDQVSRGLAHFYDTEVRQSLSGWKAIAYGVGVARIASNMPNIISQYSALLTPLGIVRDGMVDVDGLAAELRSQMEKSGGTLVIPIMGDTFTFRPADVDTLVRCIERS
jgi:hypothetical protein